MRRHFLFLLVLFCCWETTFGGRFRKNKPVDDEEPIDVPQVHPLVEYLGKEMYNYINRPKYRFYVYMALGTSLPDEQSTIAIISTVCNVLYGILVWLGFLFLRRDYMLIITLLTLYLGPAIVLVVIGLFGASIAAFAVYPVRSVLFLWTWFFLTSQIAQALGKYLGLDRDKDGDVDMLDFVHWAAESKLGKMIGLPRLYAMLNELSRDPFQEINVRLDALMDKLTSGSSPNKATGVSTTKVEATSPLGDGEHRS